MPAGTNADLILVEDLNNDGTVQSSEILAASHNASNANETISHALVKGHIYFAGVTNVSGTTNYSLRLSYDTAGSSIAAAFPMTTTGIGSSVSEFVDSTDTSDFYTLTVPALSRVGFFLAQFTQPISFTVAKDTNGNGTIDSGETLFASKSLAPSQFAEFLDLKAGTYVMIVGAVGGAATDYTLTIGTNQPDHAGDTVATARNIGVLGAATQTFSESVGPGSIHAMDDLNDFYKFSFGSAGPYNFSAQLTGLTGDADLIFYRDTNDNGILEDGEELQSSKHTGTTSESIINQIRTPGVYYLQVALVSGTANYTLTLAAPSVDTAGNTLATAMNLGTLNTVINTADQFVGRIDEDDFFKFTVATNSEGSFVLTSNISSTVMEVIKDVNGNNQIDSGDVMVRTSPGLTGTTATINGLFLPAGNYFIHVVNDSDTTYSVLVQRSTQTPFGAGPIQISPTATTKIEFEDYDNGGEGVAYHDATPTNDGGTIRTNESVEIKTTSDVGGGGRITATTVGEYIEYSIFLPQAGGYDAAFRVSSNHPGASFHIEIDGVDETGPIAVPNTGSFDSMTTVPTAGARIPIVLTAGPHILRLAYNTGTGQDNNFAGSYNFMTLTPDEAFTGVPILSPPPPTVAVGQPTQLQLSWTVPQGGWHILKDVDLYLVDDEGQTIADIRFDEASSTMALFNARKNRFGPAKAIGSNSVLHSGGVRLNLAGCAVAAAGPTSDTVHLTFDLTLSHRLAAKHLTVQASARDDLGHAERPATVGDFDVVKKHGNNKD
jgi:hypothetical protein